ncbi:hypothetical protein C0966_04785 [Bacillus methanolicus]|nr:hypothetical protein [Bacillus methanolicus]
MVYFSYTVWYTFVKRRREKYAKAKSDISRKKNLEDRGRNRKRPYKTPINGFMIIYITAIIQLKDSLWNKIMQVVKSILAYMNTFTNILIIITQGLSDNSKGSK